MWTLIGRVIDVAMMGWLAWLGFHLGDSDLWNDATKITVLFAAGYGVLGGLLRGFDKKGE